jgi:rubrerythrin
MMDLAQITRPPVAPGGLRAGGGPTRAGGSAAALAACGSAGDGEVGASSDTDIDVAVLNRVLVLELTAVEAYSRGSKLLEGEALAAGRAFLTQEQEHADALTKAIKLLGGAASGDPMRLDYSELKSQRDVLAFATDLENVAIAAYVDAIPRLSTGALRASAAEIAADEAEHVAVLAGLLGRPQVPDAFVTGDPGDLSGASTQTGVKK